MKSKIQNALACCKCDVEDHGGNDYELAVTGLEPKARLRFEKHSQEEAGHIDHR
jgi:hypothetical protein